MTLLDNIQTNAAGRNGTGAGVGAHDRRASAWLDARLKRGQKERFTEIGTVTPQMAERMLALNEGPEFRNRYLSQQRVIKYADMMQRGLWILSTQGISFSASGRLIDGQHRMAAVVQSGQSVNMTIWFGCEDAEFMVVDQGTTRTAGDLIHIEGKNYNKIRAAVANLDLRIRERSVRSLGAQRVVLHEDAMDQDILEESCRMSMNSGRLTTPTAGAFAYYLIVTQSAHAKSLPEFWEGFYTGANLGKTSPILKLRNMLAEGYNKGSGIERGIKPAAAIVLAWNAWVQNKRAPSLVWGHLYQMPEVV